MSKSRGTALDSTALDMDRRSFVKLVGGGVVVFASLRPSTLLGQRRSPYPEDFNAYLRIDEAGTVTVFSGKIEMGQGVMTSQAQMAAEDLGVALESIEMVLGDTDRCPWDMGTFGSLTTRMFGPAVRAAIASAVDPPAKARRGPPEPGQQGSVPSSSPPSSPIALNPVAARP